MKNIIIYSSATKEGVNISAHSIFKASSDKKYNHIIGIEGTITTVAPIDKDDENINVCYVGGIDAFGKVKDTRTEQQKNALNKLVPFKVPFNIAFCLSLVPLGTCFVLSNLNPSNVNTFK